MKYKGLQLPQDDPLLQAADALINGLHAEGGYVSHYITTRPGDDVDPKPQPYSVKVVYGDSAELDTMAANEMRALIDIIERRAGGEQVDEDEVASLIKDAKITIDLLASEEAAEDHPPNP